MPETRFQWIFASLGRPVNAHELHKGGVYVWRLGDPKFQTTLRVTQITTNLVRAVALEGMPPKPTGKRFWNPKCIFLDECTPVSAGERHGDV